jgi:hypothetical protein
MRDCYACPQTPSSHIEKHEDCFACSRPPPLTLKNLESVYEKNYKLKLLVKSKYNL